MRFRALFALLLVTTLFVIPPQPRVGAADQAVAMTGSTVDDDTTQPTVNEFLPKDRSLGDCLSSLPKPNCGSDARGGWAQTTVFLAMLAALGFIAWRIVAGSRRARAARARE